MHKPVMTPPPGERLLRFVGDRVRFAIGSAGSGMVPGECRAFLRTTLGRGASLIETHLGAITRDPRAPESLSVWRDVPMRFDGAQWSLGLTLAEVGYFEAKPYLVDGRGRQHWPDGSNAGVSVHPSHLRTANTLYCAFTRLFGPLRRERVTTDEALEAQLRGLEARGYATLPPSGKLRDVVRMLPHIVNTLGCRILHLLPVNPTPTTFARFGRFGSPYAAEDLTAIDPALVDFDRRTTGIQQFEELTLEAHRYGARVFLDLVTNHTGWGSTLQEEHPEWFLRHPDGSFVSPGAWGVTWEDLVELDQSKREVWDHLARAFLEWCRRGVDGFRCDAAYKVPVAVWQHIVARVRREFPDAVFLVEGLGGAWQATESLLTDGGAQWAYSELFQEYSGVQVAGYLDHALRQSRRVGVLVHYSETHDNERLAARGRAWSLLRNRLCALTSVHGGFGFTCGVEWLAAERILVHGSRGLGYGNEDNIVPELSRLNAVLAEHPCFFDGATLTRVSAAGSPVYALRRVSAEALDEVLVLVNTDPERAHGVEFRPPARAEDLQGFAPDPALHTWCDLLGQASPSIDTHLDGTVTVRLAPGAAFCLAPRQEIRGSHGAGYRDARCRVAWAVRALATRLAPEDMGPYEWMVLAAIVDEDPAGFLGAIGRLDASSCRDDLVAALRVAMGAGRYPQVVEWSLLDRRRVTPVPPGHWLLLRDSVPFRSTLVWGNDPFRSMVESTPADGGHVVWHRHPGLPGGGRLVIERSSERDAVVEGRLAFLGEVPAASRWQGPVSPEDLVLLTNGRGGMARLRVDLGTIRSKYDCLLGANLHLEVPVDRHVFVKRVRIWANFNRFLSRLDGHALEVFRPGPPAVWTFSVPGGDRFSARVQVSASMIDQQNTVLLRFHRVGDERATAQGPLHLTVRFDLEDRNFHHETRRNGGAEYHFQTHVERLPDLPGFSFTPAADRQLHVFADNGDYRAEAEWSENVPHPIEAERGQVGSGDAFSPGCFEIPLEPGEVGTIVVTAEGGGELVELLDGALFSKEWTESTTEFSGSAAMAFESTLQRSCRSFLVRRGRGRTVVAGYPWFLDWGRDTLIAARGLLAAGWIEEVRDIVLTFGRFEQQGTLPNSIHGEDASNRDTSDASLWFGVVCEELAAECGPVLYTTPTVTGGPTVADVLARIGRHYIAGTPNGIRMDPASGLIWSPAHFTWMDTNFPAGTPRRGYPVEIQALWIRLLRQLQRLGAPAGDEAWGALAERALASVRQLFWLEEPGWYGDLVHAEAGQAASAGVVDTGLRSNALLWFALGIEGGERARRMVAAAARFLVVPGALRSLAPLPISPPLPVWSASGQLLNDPERPYWGEYVGDEDTRRKPAYHNGTAWTWTFPAFCEALVLAWERSPEAVAAARAYLGSVDRLLGRGCLGHLPEIVDGDFPHAQRGCDAQGWSATEALRVWKWLGTLAADSRQATLPPG